ncbi:dTDP-4-dehydrorhamnose reductase [Bacillus sp. ZZV12-4809]|nr:dTDP-4-dehydrorhamnose reductase [Bacillus sp. ZZV12-4809]
MKALLIGSTGMLGQTLFKKLKENNFSVITSSRNNSDNNIDFLTDGQKITEVIIKEKPEIVINAAALVNLNYCESNPGNAYIVNSRLPGLIAQACSRVNSYFVQISTDHYYSNDGKKGHKESDKVELFNEYARTKFAGESFTLTYYNSLVVRTNIVGFRNKASSPTFVEWVIKSLESNDYITGFNDFFTSSIDVESLSDILIELIDQKVTGLINVASSDTISKYEFIATLATLLGKEQQVKEGTMNSSQGIKRANSLGLDMTKLQSILKHNHIPSSKEVIINIYNQYKEGAYHELQK